MFKGNRGFNLKPCHLASINIVPGLIRPGCHRQHGSDFAWMLVFLGFDAWIGNVSACECLEQQHCNIVSYSETVLSEK